MAVWGFVIVAACSFLVALSLAELASCYPLAGGPYFWRVPHISWAVTGCWSLQELLFLLCLLYF